MGYAGWVSTKEERDKRLDAVVKAAQDWQDGELSRLNGELVRLKTIMRARTGADRLKQSLVEPVSAMLSKQLSKFIGD